MENSTLLNALNSLLSNYQIYYQNLRGFHWNVTGFNFFGLHEKFEELYLESAENVDEIAERILAIGGKPLHTFEDYLETASIKSAKNITDGKDTVAYVLENSQILLRQLKSILNTASELNDEGTVSLISDLISNTEKRIWMLKAFLR